MPKKSLIETNPYLKDSVKRKALFCTTVSSSTAIEGVHVTITEAIKPPMKSSEPVISEIEESGASRR